MQYTFPIDIPANTTEEAPVRVPTPLHLGQLTKVAVYFPWGCAGYAHVRILHYEHQLYPTNPDEWLAGNEILIEFACEYDIEEGHNEFKVEAYNEDDFYPHTPIISFNVLRGAGAGSYDVGWVEG